MTFEWNGHRVEVLDGGRSESDGFEVYILYKIEDRRALGVSYLDTKRNFIMFPDDDAEPNTLKEALKCTWHASDITF